MSKSDTIKSYQNATVATQVVPTQEAFAKLRDDNRRAVKRIKALEDEIRYLGNLLVGLSNVVINLTGKESEDIRDLRSKFSKYIRGYDYSLKSEEE